MLEQLAKDLSGFSYVIQRNWDNLPRDYKVDGHEDIDIFVHEDDRNALEQAIAPYREHIPIDVRSERDNYYPPNVAILMLEAPKEYNGFYVPNEFAHFISLYYHNMVHKKDNPYGKKLNQLFAQIYRPVKCTDQGVEFNDSNFT